MKCLISSLLFDAPLPTDGHSGEGTLDRCNFNQRTNYLWKVIKKLSHKTQISDVNSHSTESKPTMPSDAPTKDKTVKTSEGPDNIAPVKLKPLEPSALRI